ncbi:MAG: YidB family protein [Acidobacteriota bacterium]
MDILKTVTGMMGGTASGQAAGVPNPLEGLLQMLSQREGGLNGLVTQLRHSGLGDVVGSWIGTGQNLPVSAEQLGGIFSAEQMTNFAKMLGTNIGTAQAHMTELLPQVIDKLSPQGTLPEGDDWMSQAGSMLGGLLGGQR